jgi:hypothetical protein
VPLIFLDLFIAIILEGFEQMNKNINIVIPAQDLEKFRDCWSEFDKDVSRTYETVRNYFNLLFLGHWFHSSSRFPLVYAGIERSSGVESKALRVESEVAR